MGSSSRFTHLERREHVRAMEGGHQGDGREDQGDEERDEKQVGEARNARKLGAYHEADW